MTPRLLSLVLPALAAPVAAQNAPVYVPFDDEVLYDADGDETTTDDQVRLNGNLATYYHGSACSDLGAGSTIVPGGCGYDLEVLGVEDHERAAGADSST